MFDFTALKKAWSLLERRERRNAWIVLAVVCVAALSTAVMVGSLFPFLSVLADPSRITENPQFNWAYETFGFESSYSFLVALGLATLAVIVLSNGLQLARTYVITRYSQMRSHTISRKLLGLYLSHSYEFFLDRHSAEMSTRVLSEAQQTVGSFFRPLAEVVAGGLTVLAIIMLLIWVNPAVAIGAFVIFGGSYAVIFAIVRGKLNELGQLRLKSNQQRHRVTKEVLAGIKEVKLHGHEEAYLNRFSASSFRTMQTAMTSELIGNLPRYFLQTLALGGVILLCLLLLGRAEFEAGSPALGELLPLLGLIAFAGQRMMPELTRIYSNIAKMKFGAAAVEKLYEDLQTSKSRLPGPNSAHDPLGLKSELVLRNISYRYSKAHTNSLSDASLTIRAGERIGIVGGTGAGKTTVADIVLGLLEPSEGTLLSDGVAIDDGNRRMWQQSVGYVPQEIFLIDASIAENIAFGVPPRSLDRERVETVGRIAQLEGFVQGDLPAGYDTKIGERGVRLSGGQRQRIGIARALYRGADLIVFDEATSALDNVTERDVMSAIEAIPGNTTILIIAHRLSTVKSCDRIVVLDRGKIVGIGPWAELLEQNPSFRGLAEAA
ncbi:ABC transporter ATP-binding protein [Roseibacterium sp. SDUM158017]|uniref:ABC transporter ATP-binding protein n=1 Tax=Roseicyclus salinarum TaxID=3036773 RepID=UPI002415427F|nr:ABC transporter ATP-binding protein [Roseibacterium sp. SDUM158017]MDG4649627.1 ABC transporter ATP-binding protein [Roseibacterium sp. SDUM158017]